MFLCMLLHTTTFFEFNCLDLHIGVLFNPDTSIHIIFSNMLLYIISCLLYFITFSFIMPQIICAYDINYQFHIDCLLVVPTSRWAIFIFSSCKLGLSYKAKKHLWTEVPRCNVLLIVSGIISLLTFWYPEKPIKQGIPYIKCCIHVLHGRLSKASHDFSVCYNPYIALIERSYLWLK